ncbi:Protein of unknown function [Micromonospora rhizosphaerae]|uniref:DUF2567 domain-containing protein n=1 Tax=Micromonospora rhizosphaerae TaxID=568872 RepID=A0A1C6T777_9ACTN|nr:hypothetical protein [Micromonospora rhizosphaerae]SCL37422.1 Protein of unknown function [Micromonospora rhizosphaerae]
MSPDTSDPEQPVDRPVEPGRPGPAPDRPFDGPAGAHRPGSDADRPGGFAPPDPDRAAPGWPGGLPVPAGTPVTAPGADPFAWYAPGPEHMPGAGTTGPADDRRRAVGVTLGVAFLLTVLGAPLGLLWAAVAPDTPAVKTAEGVIYAQPQPEEPIAADGWFALLGLGFGVLAAIAVWFLLRRRRGPVGLLGGTVGGLGAALVAWQLGRRIGLSAYQRLVETAPDGRAFTKPADLRAGGVDWLLGVLPVPHGNLLLPAFGVAVTYTLLAGWSRWPSLRPEPEPDAAWRPAVPAAGLSSGWGDRPARSAAPEPPAPGGAEPPRG